jgi:hypothetical protein
MSPSPRWSLLLVVPVFVFASVTSEAFAQNAPPPNPAEAPPPPPPPPPPPEAPPPPMAPPPAAAAPGLVPPSQPPFKMETPNTSTVRVGFLLQPQFQALNANSALDSYAINLYVRRVRFLLGGTLFGMFDYFFDTDFPNLFLPNVANPVAGGPALKNTPGMNVQDAFITWRAMGDMLKIDAGYMLPPLSHNSVQGATTLYSWDYFSYTFAWQQPAAGNVFGAAGNPVGRDTGFQLRGLVVDGHLEYRLGLFQGFRDGATPTDVGARNFFRLTGRVQVNLFDPEPGFFYAGTYLGAKRILSIGGAFDIQNDYRYFDGDAFVDLPLGPGVVTGQLDVAHWNGHGFIPVPEQTALSFEGGYRFAGFELSPIVRVEHLFVPGADNDQTQAGIGGAWWPFGHNTNVKAFYTRIQTQGAVKGQNQFNVQWQLYFF